MQWRPHVVITAIDWLLRREDKLSVWGGEGGTDSRQREINPSNCHNCSLYQTAIGSLHSSPLSTSKAIKVMQFKIQLKTKEAEDSWGRWNSKTTAVRDCPSERQNCGQPVEAPRQTSWETNKLVVFGLTLYGRHRKRELGLIKQHAALKNTCCSFRGLEFSSQHPHRAAYNHLHLHLQGIWCPLLGFAGVPTATYRRIIRNKNF